MVLRGGKKAAGEPPPAGGPAWVPRPALLAAACGLPPGEPPCPEAKLFLEQATIVVSLRSCPELRAPAPKTRWLSRILCGGRKCAVSSCHKVCNTPGSAAQPAASRHLLGAHCNACLCCRTCFTSHCSNGAAFPAPADAELVPGDVPEPRAHAAAAAAAVRGLEQPGGEDGNCSLLRCAFSDSMHDNDLRNFSQSLYCVY